MLSTKSKKGIAIYLVIVILSLLSGIAFGLSFVVTKKIIQTREMGQSVKAFFGADTGIERAMYKLYKQGQDPPFSFSGSLDGVSYSVLASPPGSEGCNGSYYCLKSVGTFKKTSRAIEASF